jgi:hypothetical protein
VYLPSLSNKPLYVVNTGRDRLYPAAQVLPFIEKMREVGVEVTYRVYEDIGHQPGYAVEERPRIMEFLKKNVRSPHPERISIETQDPKWGGWVHWVRLEELGEADGEFPFGDHNVEIKQTRLMLGINLDPEYGDGGVKVVNVREGTAASGMGMKVGDVIVEMDGAETPGLDELRAALAKKKFGDKVVVKVLREGEELTLRGEFPVPKPQKAFVRNAPSGRIEARAEGNVIDVRTRGVRKFTLFISADRFDLSSEIEVRVNGQPRYSGKPAVDAALMLELAAKFDDRTMIYHARITVELDPPSGDADEGDF